MTRETKPSNYAESAANFRSLIVFDAAGSMESFSAKDGWQLAGEEVYTSKMTATNNSEGLFVKIYPDTYRFSQGYAKRVFRTFKALGQLTDLQYPILLPLSLEGDVLVFKKGQEIATLSYGDLEQDTRSKVNAVVEKHEFTPLQFRSTISLIRIDGQDYLADPFADSIVRINEFYEKQHKKTQLINPKDFIGRDLRKLAPEEQKVILEQYESLRETALGYRLGQMVKALQYWQEDFSEKLSQADKKEWTFQDKTKKEK